MHYRLGRCERPSIRTAIVSTVTLDQLHSTEVIRSGDSGGWVRIARQRQVTRATELALAARTVPGPVTLSAPVVG